MYQYHREVPAPLQGLWDVLEDHVATTPSVGRMIVRASAFVGITALLVGPYAVVGLLGARAKRPIAKLWFRTCTTICGLTVSVRGTPNTDAATLLAANHISYLDIIVLGAWAHARFVAKSDVADWPVFGRLAKMADTVFVTRDRRAAAKDSKKLTRLVEQGECLILFPEGTSSNGRSVLPFRSALFAAADPSKCADDVRVQPVSIAYTVDAVGRPLSGALGDCYAWYGDMTLFGHLMTVFGLKGASVELTFHPSIRPQAFGDRKALAAAVEHSVRKGLQASLREDTERTP